MVRYEMKNCNKILTEEQQKDQFYHHVKLINPNILQAKKYYLLFKVELQNKVSLLLIFLQEERQKNTQRQLKIKVKNK